jgi:hypothetical protein
MSEVCCIKGCEKPVLAMGMCVNHWRMNKKHGSPVAVRPLSAANRGLTAEQRFWKSVTKTDTCWLWKSGCDLDGYGKFHATIFGIKTTKAHRYSHMLATGEVLNPHTLVMHSCDTPGCVNPDHLSSGTAAENMADMVRKGRHLPGRQIANQKIIKISDEQVLEILKDTRSYAEIARDYGIHKQHVLDIKARRTRRHVAIDFKEIARSKRGTQGEKRSELLKEQDVLDIRASKDSGRALADRYGVSQQTICDIRKRRSWRHLPDGPIAQDVRSEEDEASV